MLLERRVARLVMKVSGEGHLAYSMQASAQSVAAANPTSTATGKKGGKVSRSFTPRILKYAYYHLGINNCLER
jgi:hypothetical protein